MSINLEKCKVCGGDVAPKIYKCPHCGGSLRSVRSVKGGIISLACMPVVIIACILLAKLMPGDGVSVPIPVYIGVLAMIGCFVAAAVCFTKPSA